MTCEKFNVGDGYPCSNPTKVDLSRSIPPDVIGLEVGEMILEGEKRLKNITNVDRSILSEIGFTEFLVDV